MKSSLRDKQTRALEQEIEDLKQTMRTQGKEIHRLVKQYNELMVVYETTQSEREEAKGCLLEADKKVHSLVLRNGMFKERETAMLKAMNSLVSTVGKSVTDIFGIVHANIDTLYPESYGKENKEEARLTEFEIVLLAGAHSDLVVPLSPDSLLK